MLIHRSNRSECLVDLLVDLVREALPDPLSAEWIVVQSRGMERWLTQQLARRLGVWANPRFPFPRALIERLLGAAEPALSTEQALTARGFEQQALVWSLAALFQRHAEHPELAVLSEYLSAPSSAARHARLFQLAERLAQRFDDYALYRPDLTQRWERGEDADWQAFAWRGLVQRHGAEHMAARAQRYFAAARAGQLRLDGLPTRLSLFGVASMPPLYLRILEALPASIEVHLFVVSPCRQYWSQIRTERSIDRALEGATRDALHFEVGNPLLASFGRLGREFAELLERGGAHDGQERYDAPDDATLLGALQADILDLRDPQRGSESVPRRVLAPNDDSLSIHACHSPTRELQVLHDQLLDLFERDESLQPRDVVVMTPDIEAYAPVVEAVFGAREVIGSVPWQVSDRSVAATHEVVDAWFALLEALPSRMGAGRVLDLLGYEAVRRRFGIVAEELEVCRAWVAQSGVRWGIDAAHRQREGQPPLDENTWRFGLERLLLGRAIGSDAGLYFGRLASDAVEGSEAEVLGQLVSFARTLFEASEACSEPRPVLRWVSDLGDWLERLLHPTAQTQYQAQALRDALTLIAERATAAGFDDAIDLATLAVRLERALDEVLSPKLGARGFLAGGVTFCQLTPMRSIPFRVVCLVGMDDEAFPRSERPLSFDRMNEARRIGDRSRRDDDRYLFLEALLSARERLWISYVGQGVQDNEPRPASVVVLELLDAVRRGFVLPGHDAEQDTPIGAYEARLQVRHPLQPFSPRYFRVHGPGDRDARLFSYAAHYCEGAKVLVAGPRAAVSRVPERSAPRFEAGTEITIEDLERTLVNPAREYLKRRLGVFLGTDAVALEEREPIELDALERWELGTSLLEQSLSADRGAHVLALERAQGRLPLGTPGLVAFQAELPLARTLLARGEALRGGEQPSTQAFALEVAGVRLLGSLDAVTANGRVEVQYSKLSGSNELKLWLRHLVLNCVHAALSDDDPRRTSHMVARDDGGGVKTVEFPPVPDAQALLESLVELAAHAQQGALVLFKYASRAYADGRAKSKTEEQALDSARTTFEATRGRGDLLDPYVRTLYPSFDAVLEAPEPLSFGRVADTVYERLLALRKVS